MAATASALLLAGAVLLVAEWFRGRRELVRDLEALAAIVADQTTASVAFQDPGNANEILRSLHSKQHVAAACIYLLDGRRFAAYGLRNQLGRCPERVPGEAAGGRAG